MGAVPTANGGITRAAYEAARRAGLAVEPLLAKAGLTVRQAKSSDLRIPVRAQIAFLNLVAAELKDEFLGARLAREMDLRELGLLYYVVASSDTLGDAMHRAARYSSLQNEGVEIVCTDGQDLSIGFAHVGVARHLDRHQIEFFVTILLRICRTLTGLELTPSTIRLVHHRSKLPSDVARLFGGEVRFDSSADEVVFPKSAAMIPAINADPYLNSLLVRYFDEALANRPSRSTAWRQKTENAIATLLPHGRPQFTEICTRLAVTPRTLARRLASEGTTFVAVLDTLRRDLAMRYLQERELPISEIAWLLGYQDSSAFTHAFKRWTKRTPKQARQRG